ncbi:phosphonate C-P lyase system protein PhnH [Ochrobactrum sp. CM-21-5]|nr:phosphonate C-P lyase system protein PhnH [Ochrobactrum sp. CM-21-5]MBC2886590.1 phosphonate C-P lyase system protein PhnH [Ochrobactrum sp. CM-21-5]
MLHSSSAFEGGLADPVNEAQSAFRAVMHAIANPGRIYSLVQAATPPQPLTPELGVLAATLLDHDASVWVDAEIAVNKDATAWLTFHTGAPIVDDQSKAQFALVTGAQSLPALSSFAQGNAEFPDRSTTIVLAVSSLETGQCFNLKGPGIKDEHVLHVEGLPQDFIAQWRENGAQFPLGVDLVLVCEGAVAALPRTTRVASFEHDLEKWEPVFGKDHADEKIEG